MCRWRREGKKRNVTEPVVSASNFRLARKKGFARCKDVNLLVDGELDCWVEAKVGNDGLRDRNGSPEEGDVALKGSM